MSGWGVVYLLVVLKIPVVLLLYLVWWAVHQVPDPAPGARDGDGGPRRRPHPRGPLPRSPRRGPHGTNTPGAPERTRTPLTRARPLEHR